MSFSTLFDVLAEWGPGVTCRVGPKDCSRSLPPSAATSRRRKDAERRRLVGWGRVQLGAALGKPLPEI
jgi:hypothetical protein